MWSYGWRQFACQQWFGDYETLEVHHGYVQWLFPIHEEGMNHMSQVLQNHEKQAMVQVGTCRLGWNRIVAEEGVACL